MQRQIFRLIIFYSFTYAVVMISLYETYRLYYAYHADEQEQSFYARIVLNLVSMIVFPVLALTRARRILGMHTSYLRSFVISFSIFLAGSVSYIIYFLYRRDIIDVSLGGELIDFEYMRESILALLLILTISTVSCAVISLFFRKPKFTEQAISERLSGEFDLIRRTITSESSLHTLLILYTSLILASNQPELYGVLSLNG